MNKEHVKSAVQKMGSFDYRLKLNEKEGVVFYEALEALCKGLNEVELGESLYGLGFYQVTRPDTVKIPFYEWIEPQREVIDHQRIELEAGGYRWEPVYGEWISGHYYEEIPEFAEPLPQSMTPTLWQYFEVEPPPGYYEFYWHEITWPFHWPEGFRERVYRHFEQYGCGNLFLKIATDGVKISDMTFDAVGKLFKKQGIKSISSRDRDEDDNPY